MLQQSHEPSFHHIGKGFYGLGLLFTLFGFPCKMLYNWLSFKSIQVFHFDVWKIMEFHHILFLQFVLLYLSFPKLGGLVQVMLYKIYLIYFWMT